MSHTVSLPHDVIVIGAGPTGLTLANHLGQAGVRVLLLEKLPDIIDYPRAVGMDDEALRSFQAVGLASAVEQHITPNHIARFIRPDGKLLAEINPTQRPFGWARRNAFNQSLVDRELLNGLARFPNVEVRFGAEVVAVEDMGDRARVTIEGSGVVESAYVVGAEGGRSIVRETMRVDFAGQTAPTRFLVVDIANDPIGRPNLDFIVHPKRPIVSIALPSQIRRLEFGVADNELASDIDITEDAMRAKLRDLFSDAEIDRLKIIRRRVYVHNARVASSFRSGRLLLAGDAAHLMPVWQGQGFNSGVRDATNLAWKLAMVVRGLSSPALLDAYDAERHDHAEAMVAVSVAMGKIFAPPNALLRVIRNLGFAVAAKAPPLRDYVSTMRWKPMPRLTRGAVVRSGPGRKADLAGTIFAQFVLTDGAGHRVRSDDAFGAGFALVSWGSDPTSYVSAKARARFERIGGRIFTIFPACQQPQVPSGGAMFLFDPDGSVKLWFDDKDLTCFLVRPDRIIGASCMPVQAGVMIDQFCETLSPLGIR